MNVAKVLKMIKDKEVKFVDLWYTDTKGKWQHTAQTASTIDENTFKEGIMFDGSSIAGWKNINESDMILMPDPNTAVMDPFTAQPQMILFCDVYLKDWCTFTTHAHTAPRGYQVLILKLITTF